MGARSGGGAFVSSNWKKGIREIQEDAEYCYGHQDGYSGAENSCDFTYAGDKSALTKKEYQKYVENRMNCLDSGEGEVVSLGVVGYAIISTEIKECSSVPFDYLRVLKSFTGPAVLVEYQDKNRYEPKESGTVSELKHKVHNYLRNCNYETHFYIVGRNKVYLCTGKSQIQTKTQRKSDLKVLVVPQYNFEYYGWYKE